MFFSCTREISFYLLSAKSDTFTRMLQPYLHIKHASDCFLIFENVSVEDRFTHKWIVYRNHMILKKIKKIPFCNKSFRPNFVWPKMKHFLGSTRCNCSLWAWHFFLEKNLKTTLCAVLWPVNTISLFALYNFHFFLTTLHWFSCQLFPFIVEMWRSNPMYTFFSSFQFLLHIFSWNYFMFFHVDVLALLFV